MKRSIVNGCFLALIALAWVRTNEHPARASQAAESGSTNGVSGQGKMRFRVVATSDLLPPEAQSVLKAAHGGFAVDLRPGKGETYFSLKGGGIIQLSGEIMVCDIEALKSAALQNPKLLALLMRHEQTVYGQAQQSAACFATHQVEARLCRWLLRARDLSGSDYLPFTQEYLAEMLGVRRTSVTAVAHT